MDRGGDRGELFLYLSDRKLRFIIRLRGERLLEGTQAEPAVEMARDCPALLTEYLVKEESDQEKPLRLEVGYRRVRLPGRPEPLTLVVVKGLGAEPLMLLTNLAVKNGAANRSGMW